MAVARSFAKSLAGFKISKIQRRRVTHVTWMNSSRDTEGPFDLLAEGRRTQLLRAHPSCLAFRVGQDVKISNGDPFSHNIHPLAKINREWNRIQPPGTPPFSYSYENEEFITIKCNIHAWMKAYFVVLKTSHFAVTGEDGHFWLPDLPPGRYTVTAWHEVFGTQTREITIGHGESQTVDFVFHAKP